MMVEYSNRWYVRRALTPWRFNVFVFLMLLLLCGCHSGLRSDGERLNRQAYSYHYRDVGKTVEYARKVLALENSSDGDRAEAYNHLAFACIVAMDYEGARALLDSVRRVTDNVVELLIADIVFASRYPDRYGLPELKEMIAFGGSPRASINLAKASRAYAFIKRRGYVVPEDVRAVAHDVLRHRIGLSYEAEASNMTSEEIVSEIINKVEVP